MSLGNDKSIIPPNSFVTVAITGLPNDMPANTRGLLCTTDGSLGITMVDGTAATVPILSGVILPGNFATLTAVVGVTAVLAVL